MQIQYYQQQPQQQIIYQQQYYQPQQQVQTVIYQQPVQFQNVVYPTQNACVYCGNPYQLLTRRKVGVKAFLMCFLLLLIFWPLFWLPFVMDDCQDRVYYCISCGAVIRTDSDC